MFRHGASRGKVVIVGAGPAGALSAIYLAKQNYDVEVKESSACTHPNDALGGYACRHARTHSGQPGPVQVHKYARVAGQHHAYGVVHFHSGSLLQSRFHHAAHTDI